MELLSGTLDKMSTGLLGGWAPRCFTLQVDRNGLPTLSYSATAGGPAKGVTTLFGHTTVPPSASPLLDS